MKQNLMIGTAVVLLATVGGCESDSPTANSPNPTDNGGVALSITSAQHGDDEVVALAQCPEAVQATILARVNGGTLKEIERTTDHGEVLYEVDVIAGESLVEFDVAEDGVFRGYENDGPEDEGADYEG